jgi:hypothetical protein
MARRKKVTSKRFQQMNFMQTTIQKTDYTHTVKKLITSEEDYKLQVQT